MQNPKILWATRKGEKLTRALDIRSEPGFWIKMFWRAQPPSSQPLFIEKGQRFLFMLGMHIIYYRVELWHLRNSSCGSVRRLIPSVIRLFFFCGGLVLFLFFFPAVKPVTLDVERVDSTPIDEWSCTAFVMSGVLIHMFSHVVSRRIHR